MPDDKQTSIPLDDDGQTGDEQKAALLQKIRQEMDAMTPQELERLYAVVALMEKKKTD